MAHLPIKQWACEKLLMHLVDCHAEDVGGIPAYEALRMALALGMCGGTYFKARRALGINTRSSAWAGEWSMAPGCIRARPSWAPAVTPAFHPGCSYCVPESEPVEAPENAPDDDDVAPGPRELLRSYRSRPVK